MWGNIKSENNIKSLSISLASPENIREWSYGEVTKPETINYKSQKPEKDGLFCEKIFGPVKDFECACGKYKKIKNKGMICERCGVEVTESIVRRERFGHIELAAPICHIWMMKTAPSKIATFLNFKAKDIEQIVYFVSYVVVNPGNSGLNKYEILDQQSGRERLLKSLEHIKKQNIPLYEDQEIDFQEYLETLSNPLNTYNFDEISSFIEEISGAKFSIGAEAIKELINDVDIDKEIAVIKSNLGKSSTETPKLTKRLSILQSFKNSENKPEYMVLDVLPVLPPNLRPIIQLDGGRFTSSDINDLYRKIIIRNDRLRKMIEAYAPKIVINNEKRMLQEAVDALFDNNRKSKPFVDKSRRPLKSLSEFLKGKRGRFRQNLLGKRVDYSGRSVIVVGPDLKMHECGIPREMALSLFKPFVINKLIESSEERNINVKIAEKMIAEKSDLIWEILEDVVKETPVLLNRAPSLHRLSIQAFYVKLVKNKAIKLHPLATTPFNADFDGDQMAVHVPLSPEAVAESVSLLLATNNINDLKQGTPITVPAQDMSLGLYFLTKEKINKESSELTKIFGSTDEVKAQVENGILSIHEIILLKADAFPEKPFLDEQKNGYIITTPGKIIFNLQLPSKMKYINRDDSLESQYLHQEDVVVFSEHPSKYALNAIDRQDLKWIIDNRGYVHPLTKKNIRDLISKIFKKYQENTAETLDNLKDIAFEYSTKSSTTFSLFDLEFNDQNGEDIIENEKANIFSEVEKEIDFHSNLYRKGLLTQKEKKALDISKWSFAKNKMQSFTETLINNPKYRDNSIYTMMDSGARGNLQNLGQLLNMRGLMSNTQNETIPIPIKSSFKQGLEISEFFISTHGSRKGMADTALKTADSGYLTRRLVDVSQDVVVTEEDCHTDQGSLVKDIIDTKNNTVIIPLRARIIGRYSFEDIKDFNGNVIVEKDTLIDEQMADKIINADIQQVMIRSVLKCNAKSGVCQKCYGIHFEDNKLVNVGEAVGIIAAQSIGEPGTQLTMRTFHSGGVADGTDITQGLPRIKELLDVTKPKGSLAIISKVNGVVESITEIEPAIFEIVVKHQKYNSKTKKIEDRHDIYTTYYESRLRVKKGQSVKIGQKITDGPILLPELLSVADVDEVQKYILKELQRVYRLQGIEISDKYFEIIIRQMMNKVQIVDPGDTNLLSGNKISIIKLKEINKEQLLRGKKPAYAVPIILGIKKAPLESDSFLSAASFQDTTRILAQAAIESKTDYLKGIKENVIVGNLINAGTGLKSKEEIIRLGKEARAKIKR